MTSRREAVEVGARLGKLGLHHSEAERICRISRSLGKIAERQCNEDTSCPKCREMLRVSFASDCGACLGTGDRYSEREAKLIAEAEGIAKAHGLAVYHQGDPRGAALYLYDPARLADDPHGTRDGKPRDIASCYSSVGIACY